MSGFGTHATILADCNACFASCEILFRPWLRNQPVVVLSNNDGNCVARNDAAKALGIKMGQPYHELKPLQRAGRLHVFSCNYALYDDVTGRVCDVLEREAGGIERYSIDECWLYMHGVDHDLTEWAASLKAAVGREVGMPIGVGVGANKTLAKAASWAAKKWARQTGNVVDLRAPGRRERLLRIMPVEEVWGIGSRLRKRLANDLRVLTAWELSQQPPRLLRRRYGLPVERTARELTGERCFGPDEAPEQQQMIASTRAFGTKVYDLPSLQSAVASHVASAAAKLRSQRALAGSVRVMAHTSPFSQGEQYHGVRLVQLAIPTNDTRDLVAAAEQGVTALYREGPAYAKAGIVLGQLISEVHNTPDLFSSVTGSRRPATMQALDEINRLMGRGTLRLGRERFDHHWAMRREFLGPSYTTQWSDLLTAS